MINAIADFAKAIFFVVCVVGIGVPIVLLGIFAIWYLLFAIAGVFL